LSHVLMVQPLIRRPPSARAAWRSKPCPGFTRHATNVAFERCTSQQRNTHSTETLEVRYRWHPWFGRTVWVHRTRALEDQEFVRCGLTPDLDAHANEIPMWMFDAGVCGHMHASDEPVVSLDALRELKSLLTNACHPLIASDPVLQAGHRDLSSTGGAHANRSEVDE
jgi:hypothetical protein